MDTSRADVPQGIASRARKGTMNILAHVASREGHHAVTLRTGAATRTLNIAPKPTGPGSSVSCKAFPTLGLVLHIELKAQRFENRRPQGAVLEFADSVF
jgi:hypothetical protein